MKTNQDYYIYCSGPLFCPEEIAGMTAISNVLENAGHKTFLPHRDGLEAYVMKHVQSTMTKIMPSTFRSIIDRAIFALDVFQIVERCDYLVFNMNGRVPDEGASVEAGIAFACGKPIVIYKNDSRTAFNGYDNSMITCLSVVPSVSNIKKLPDIIKEVSEKFKTVNNNFAVPNIKHSYINTSKNLSESGYSIF